MCLHVRRLAAGESREQGSREAGRPTRQPDLCRSPLTAAECQLRSPLVARLTELAVTRQSP